MMTVELKDVTNYSYDVINVVRKGNKMNIKTHVSSVKEESVG